MVTKVKVNMNLCSYVTTIEVTAAEDGKFDVKIRSPCQKVREFSKGLETLEMMDIMDWTTSKVLERMKEGAVGLHCSVPTGVLNAARMEAGLIAGSLAKKVKGNSWEFVVD